MISYSSRVVSLKLPEDAHLGQVVEVGAFSGYRTFQVTCAHPSCGWASDSFHKPQLAERSGLRHAIGNYSSGPLIEGVIDNPFGHFDDNQNAF